MRLRWISGKGLATAASLVLLACAILAAVAMLAQFALGRMLAADAVATADLWTRSIVREGGGLHASLAGMSAETLDYTLQIAGIDKVVLIGEDRALTPVRGTGAADELRQVIFQTAGPRQPIATLENRAYSLDRVRMFGQQSYQNWVILRPGESAGGSLAVRVDQSRTAGEMVSSFAREVLFSGGVALITFISFMAGFSYRQRQLSAENAAIRHLALHDELTGLPNRKQFEEFMGETLAAVGQDAHKAALFVLDLDAFKAVNDTLGHPVGDGLLKACARRLKASLRGDDLLARLSGDEFAIVVPRVTDPAMLAPLAERVLNLLSTPFRVEGHEVQIGCSIGLAVAPDNGTEIGTLMRNADFALYRAKSEGRRTWRFFDPKMAEDLASRRTLEEGLRRALENDQFELLYQPQVELATGRTVGYEAMLRWRLPGKGLVPASVFVSIAEETGLVVPIGEWVIRQVARDCALLPAECCIAINLSAPQLKRDGFDTFILETLKSHRVKPERIEIEINETILGRNESLAFERLEAIREAGVRIVMDAFGVGTLSLGLLSRYSFDKIKIDRSFLMDHDERKIRAILQAVCSLGDSLGFRVAGQGVETIEHAQMLRAAGCAEAQGYYFSPPMPLEQVLELQANRPKLLAAAG
jgi:diguanylate cyclase (GGDEF)-like protein